MAKRLEIFEHGSKSIGILTLTKDGRIVEAPTGFMAGILDWIKEQEHLTDRQLWDTLDERMRGQGLDAVALPD